MARFRMEEALPAAIVTRELVKSVEALIARQIAALASKEDNQDELRTALRVAVTDALGTETMHTIDEFGPSKFPDTTKAVEILFSGPWDTSLRGTDIDIQFHKNKLFSRVKISCEGSNARELAHGIAKSLNECIAPHRSSSNWLHPQAFVSGALFAVTAGVAWISAAVAVKSFRVAALFFALFLILGTYTWLLPALRPYTIFDSRLADSRSKWFDWLVKGLVGFLLFGTVLALARDHVVKLIGVG